jgi:hypothetical protein
MNTQTALTDLDRTKLENLNLRSQVLKNEADAFFRELFTRYGNPGESLNVSPAGELSRTVPPPPAPAPAPAGDTEPVVPIKTKRREK